MSVTKMINKMTKFGYNQATTKFVAHWLQLLNTITYFKNLIVGLHFFIFLTHMSNFVQLDVIYYSNRKLIFYEFKYLINDIAINL